MIAPFYFELKDGSVCVLWGNIRQHVSTQRQFKAWGDHGWYVPIKWEYI